MEDEKAYSIDQQNVSLIVRHHDEDYFDSTESILRTWMLAAEDVFHFEQQLMSILMLPDVQTEDASDYTAISVKSLHTVMPSLDWSLFLEMKVETQNKIEIPIGILRPPFFHSDHPEYINYGSFGALLGHELTVITALTIGGACSTDLVARLSFRNYKLAGLGAHTPEQLFFLSYGNSLCEKRRSNGSTPNVQTNKHSPAEWRINGALQNSADFAKAFNCQPGSPMNPRLKCTIWE
ncbi:hypothetical protein KVV02_002713 [Mortierella alpina]|uniref:Peptidase M13 C-terminal domain-containing protein n=1 Tax=Mortierella alpina TaxID=64518 RepID=A0A9P8IHI8_MORAP|nr:hypothetical protein KVV02_002713 [Mortierella alpina]